MFHLVERKKGGDCSTAGPVAENPVFCAPIDGIDHAIKKVD